MKRVGFLLLVALALSLAIANVGALDADSVQRRAVSAPALCGAASTAAVGAIDETTAGRIYGGELGSPEVSEDRLRVTTSQALLDALESGDTAAVQEAVHALVYTPAWHIVRLRVERAGHVLADVGGPYVIAPVHGVLSRGGRRLGTYVMSVQDDVGFIKLATRYVRVPVDLYRDGHFLMGTATPAPLHPADGANADISGTSYRESVFRTLSFPNGSLRVVLFIPRVPAPRQHATCRHLQVLAWGRIGENIAPLFKPLASRYQYLVDLLRALSRGLAVVREGSATIAGSGPAGLPTSGSVRYRRQTLEVYSWEPLPPTRVYMLLPAGSLAR